MSASEMSSELKIQNNQIRFSFVLASNARLVMPSACSIRHAVVMSIQHRLGVWKSWTWIARRLGPVSLFSSRLATDIAYKRASMLRSEGSRSSFASFRANQRFHRILGMVSSP